MSESETTKKTSHWYIWLLTVPVFYVLSLGPAVFILVILVEGFGFDHGIFEKVFVVYYPLAELDKTCIYAHQFFEWYGKIWINFAVIVLGWFGINVSF